MLRPVVLLACAVLATLATLTLAPPAAAASLVEVDPANGATLDRAPDAVVLTFSAPLDADAVRAAVTPPGGDTRQADVEVDGPRLVVRLASSGEGAYVVHYVVTPSGADASVEGGVGFTVDPRGAPATGGGTPWAVASAVAVAGLAAALLITYRRAQASR